MPEIIKITDLEEVTNPVSGCFLPIVDITEPAEADQTKKVKVQNLAPNLAVILAAVYPVGSIYVSAISTNPATLFGFGTWSAFGAGRVMVGFDATQSEFDTALETGGAKTHELTSSEMPSHTHTQNSHTHTISAVGPLRRLQHLPSGGDGIWARSDATPLQASSAITATNQNTGGGAAHNNMPPYITVFMWRRTG